MQSLKSVQSAICACAIAAALGGCSGGDKTADAGKTATANSAKPAPAGALRTPSGQIDPGKAAPASAPAPGSPSAPSSAASPSNASAPSMPREMAAPQATAMAPVSGNTYDFRVVTVDFPAQWTSAPPSGTMRSAQFRIPPPGGEGPSAEASVFLFVAGQGGDADVNVDRWLKQVTLPDGGDPRAKAKIATTDQNGTKVTTVDVTGSMPAPDAAMPMNAPKVDNQRMLALFAALPNGSLVVKVVGPASTLENADAAFQDIVKSIKAK